MWHCNNWLTVNVKLHEMIDFILQKIYAILSS